MNARNYTKWAACLALLGMSGSAYSLPVLIEVQDGPQDPLILPQDVHELGTSPAFDPFPDEFIHTVWLGQIDKTACLDGSDRPDIANQLVSMTNLSPNTWYDVHYVADLETSITNFDGWINGEEAFRIDYGGINAPLFLEFGGIAGIAGDAIFQPGETWEFIIQDYAHPLFALGATPELYDSTGVGFASGGFPPSTGSIVAVIPEPATLGLMLLGLGLTARRRR